MCIFLYIGDSSFLFCFPGYLRFFLCIGFAKIYGVFLYSIFSLYILSMRYGIYIQVFLSFCILPRFGGIFLYIYIETFSFCILPKLSVLPIYNEYHPFCNVFTIYRITPFLFLYFAQNLGVFLYIYIKNTIFSLYFAQRMCTPYMYFPIYI